MPYSGNSTNLNGQFGCEEKPSITKDGKIIHAHNNNQNFTMNETANLTNLDFKSWAIIIACGLLILFGLYKILRQSLSLIFWVSLVVAGALGISYVLGPDITNQIITKIKSGEIINLIPDEHKDALREHLNQDESK